MKRVVLTFLLTSLFWWVIFTYWAYRQSEQSLFIESEQIEQLVSDNELPQKNKPVEGNSKVSKAAPKNEKKSAPVDEVKQPSTPKHESVATGMTLEVSSQAQVSAQLNDSQEIIGKWRPVEGAKNPLEFTKYGTVIQTVYGELNMRYDYRINGEKIKIRYDDATFKIIKEGNTTYLEIYNSEDFSGRYRRASQPSKINASVIDKREYPSYIIGKWTPITGQENPIEFTKFNTVIHMVYGELDMRYEYSLSSDRLSVRYDHNARVVISEDANNYYLEIFNTTDFSGRYRKSK